MDVSNGRIGMMDELLAEGSKPENLIEIQKHLATQQQMADKFVALNDAKSELGKLRQSHDPLTKNQAKRLRRKLRKRYA
jgi:hypothetical protein